MRHCAAAIALLIALALPGGAARAQALVADISDHLIAVTTGFSGARLLLFGAMEGATDGDIVIVVRGPDRPLDVRRKARIAGVWVNRESVRFPAAPSFYYVASNRPLNDIAAARALSNYEIGLDHLRLPATDAEGTEHAQFRDALVRNKARQGLYQDASSSVALLGGRLFRADIVFPSNVPTGGYLVTTYLFRDGAVASAQTTPLVVSKIGLGARVFTLAHSYSALYGVAAIAIALIAGWLAGVIFRNV